MPGKLITEAECVRQLRELISTEYVPDSPTHDLTHLARVASLGEQMCRVEGGDSLIVVAAAWLHDLHRGARQSNADFFVPPERLDDRVLIYLAKAGIPDEIHDQVLEAIHYTDRFSFSDRSTYATTIEARIVRDADCLDAIGAIGIARAFSFGGAHGIALWEEG
ncbi:MAG: HD domain-containing protein, partial [Streptosporangiaceae bacterium]